MCRQLEIAESTWARWLAQYGGMRADDAKRLKELELWALDFQFDTPSAWDGARFGLPGQAPASL